MSPLFMQNSGYLLIWNDYWWAIFSCHFKWFILSNRLRSLLASYLTEVATSPSSKLECLTSGMSIYILMKFQVSSNFDFLTRICSLTLYKAFCVSLHFLWKTLPIYWYKMIIGGHFFLLNMSLIWWTFNAVASCKLRPGPIGT